MVTMIGSMITIFAVSLIMSLLTKEKIDKKTSSIDKFNVHYNFSLIGIGILVTTLCLVLMILAYFMGEQTMYVYVGFGIFALIGLYIIIRALPGADEIHVDHDDITVQRVWFYQKHWHFSQIDYARMDHNGIHVYVKGTGLCG